MADSNRNRARELREQLKLFMRLFGLHQQHQTPCGESLSVPHAHSLMRLREAESGLRISELGEHLNIDKSNVSRLCRRMEEAGHIERRPCPEDGRAKRLWLTDEGRRLAAQLDRSSLERFSRILEVVDADEAPKVIEALQTLNSALFALHHEEEST